MNSQSQGNSSHHRSPQEHPVGARKGTMGRSPSLADATMPVLTVLGGGHNATRMSSAHPQSEGSKSSIRGGPGRDLEAPLLTPSDAEARDASVEGKLRVAYNVSWVVNIALLAAKIYAYYFSGSKAVLASLVDSVVDLVSQIVIYAADWRSRLANPSFPVGQARLETIGVLACALIMALASCEVVKESISVLYDGIVEGILPDIETDMLIYIILGGATVLKLVCYVLCVALQSQSDSMVALAEDHLNDIVSNTAAAATALLATQLQGTWWVDAAGAIAISLFILWRWFEIARNQVDKIVGKGASTELIEELTRIANAHHNNLSVDCIRAYHFGARFFVEMEVIMPADFSLHQVHDISLELQDTLESLEPVERAFVHVDYQRRNEPEHRTERLLAGLPVSPAHSSNIIRGDSF